MPQRSTGWVGPWLSPLVISSFSSLGASASAGASVWDWTVGVRGVVPAGRLAEELADGPVPRGSLESQDYGQAESAGARRAD